MSVDVTEKETQAYVPPCLSMGIDIGSTTVKVVINYGSRILFQAYERHLSAPWQKTGELLRQAHGVVGDQEIATAITGSAGLGLAERIGASFTQEVFATGELVKQLQPDANCVIELGGEDAKIIFFSSGGMEERMNGSCAGGTGAFIDQMATLLNVSADELDALSLEAQSIYPIASRCGVFAKSDIQPLLNQGAKKSDVAASIYQAVVNQTIAGLAQGKRIVGKTLFLGGPLFYCRGLQRRFSETLHLSEKEAIFPKYGRIAAALGASLYAAKAGKRFTVNSLLLSLETARESQPAKNRLSPLFADKDDYDVFLRRHAMTSVPRCGIDGYKGEAWLGIDCGSTTTKLILLSDKNEILYEYYAANEADPVEKIRLQLSRIYELCGDRVNIRTGAVTGYGEELIRHAFGVEYGVVETIAHYMAAKYFQPDVDFILDIGGQDIKCFKIKNGAIDNILLNEACSSGCGSFLETFAKAMGYSIRDFAHLGLFGREPVNLGSRCTVFMNSSVKQAQRDGASVEDISAGLSISVIKNALYKVIRVSSGDEVGKHIVVQGGTFLNDAVLRAFERELNVDVVRPDIAGLMGAFGAALYSRECEMRKSIEAAHGSGLISPAELKSFRHTSNATVCGGCANHCNLTVNKFSDGSHYISGNQCERGLGLDKQSDALPNLYEFKRRYLEDIAAKPIKEGTETIGKIGLPMALGMYDLLPLWHTVLTELGFEVFVSPVTTRHTYEKGQFSIPSDTICYPAKLVHGHIEQLLESGIKTIFFPCLSYNVDEKASDNHYNCPVVAYYSEILNGNMETLNEVRFLYPYLNLDSQRQLSKELSACLSPYYPSITVSAVKKAVRAGFLEYERFHDCIRAEGEAALAYARENNKRIIILSGRPYHIDPEINHGIDKLANSLELAVVSEDSICHLAELSPVGVLNQWTYHARLYRAANYAASHDDTELIQLVSFGCGVDAITTDEVRSILERAGKQYTQIKIDEIINLSAVKIRLRSLLGALEQKEAQS